MDSTITLDKDLDQTKFCCTYTKCGQSWYTDYRSSVLRNLRRNCTCPMCGEAMKVIVVGVT